MTGKTITKHEEIEANLVLKSNENHKLDTSLDGNVLSSSPNSTMRTLAYEKGDRDGKLFEFEIIYDAVSAIFTGGDTITGKIRIVLNDCMKMRLIKLQFKGRVNVSWSENKSKESRTTEHVFFDKHIVLLERRPGQEVPCDFVLPAGIHVLPFIFPLPKHLPTSFEGDDGSIRYYCRAFIMKPWKHDHVTKRAFTILSPSVAPDLTQLKPISVSERSAVPSLCCLSGFVTWEMSLSKQVYAPGETISVAAKVSNLSRRQISKAIVSLVQLVTYRIGKGTDKSVTSTRVVAERIFEKPLRDGKIHWNQEPMFRVPSTAPTFIHESVNLLRVEYELRVELTMSGGRPKQPLQGRLPVTIVLATNGTKSTKYVDAVFGNVNIREDDENEYLRGRLQFCPSYPMIET